MKRVESWRDSTMGSPHAAPTTRLASLDSVRGLAALSVVICHYLILLQDTAFGREAWHWLWVPPLSLLSTAYGSVILFFVLSGYVLALSLLGEKNPNWLVFAIRRFFRIWPAYAIIIFVSFVIGHTVAGSGPVAPSIWRTVTWHSGGVSLAELLNQLAMTSSHISLDIPAWSLVHELRISLALPLLLIAVRRAPAITLLASFSLQLAGREGPPWLTALVPDTVAYIVYFCLGAWLATFQSRIGELMQVTSLAKVLLCIIGLILLSVPINIAFSGTFAGFGACLIIATATASPEITRALSTRWCELLGRVSYSLYLTHLVVLLTLIKLLGSSLSIGLILTIAVPIIGVVAAAGYYWIEQPSIGLGRAVAIRVRAMKAAPQKGGKERYAALT